jgi:methylated-DNA-protein-cysteine methyltransferase-like protein
MGFFDDVYEIVKSIPPGKVATYGQIATMAGQPGKARIVGWALHSNPSPGVIPCHRIVNRFGELSGSFAFGGMEVQRKLLEQEGILFLEDGTIDMYKFQWKWE